MTIYVDDMRLTARVGRLTARWSHLFSDTDDAELHAFARRLGLRTAWFQHAGDPIQPRRHYDVTDSKRTAAIRLGATPISTTAYGRMITAARRRNRTTDQQTGHGEAPC